MKLKKIYKNLNNVDLINDIHNTIKNIFDDGTINFLKQNNLGVPFISSLFGAKKK